MRSVDLPRRGPGAGNPTHTESATVADIGVERRRRPGVWPWIAGLIVLGLLIWGLTSLLDGDDDVVVEESVPAAPASGQ